jgi:dTDP-4-amino-4,6-dideoxygalactose transaminase
VSEELCARVVSLPLYPQLRAQEQEQVIDATLRVTECVAALVR